MSTQVVAVQAGSVATLLVPASTRPHLVQNTGINTLYIGDDSTFQWNDPTTKSVAPGASVFVDGEEALYGTAAPNLPTTVDLVAGGTGFFQPVTSITIPTGATNGERLVLNGLTGTITGYNADSINGVTGIAYIISPIGYFGYQS